MVNTKLSDRIYAVENENNFKTLKDVMPKEFVEGKYINTKAYKFKDINVLRFFSD